MDGPEPDPSQTRNTRRSRSSLYQRASSSRVAPRIWWDYISCLVTRNICCFFFFFFFYHHTFKSVPMLLQSAGVLFLLPLLGICFHPWRSVASPPISSSSYALYKHGAENSSITSCLRTLTPPTPSAANLSLL